MSRILIVDEPAEQRAVQAEASRDALREEGTASAVEVERAQDQAGRHAYYTRTIESEQEIIGRDYNPDERELRYRNLDRSSVYEDCTESILDTDTPAERGARAARSRDNLETNLLRHLEAFRRQVGRVNQPINRYSFIDNPVTQELDLMDKEEVVKFCSERKAGDAITVKISQYGVPANAIFMSFSHERSGDEICFRLKIQLSERERVFLVDNRISLSYSRGFSELFLDRQNLTSIFNEFTGITGLEYNGDLNVYVKKEQEKQTQLK